MIAQQGRAVPARPVDGNGGEEQASAGAAPLCDGLRTANVLVLVPAFNEERCIGSVVLRALQNADAVLVVDDGSTDGTAEIARAAGAIVIRHEQNLGKGTALNSGLRKARELCPDVVVLIDGDGQHRPQEMCRVIAPVLAGEADIVVGSRYLDRNSRVPRHRVLGHWAFNVLTSGASGVTLSDSQSGYRALSPRALAALSFRSDGFSVESEMQFIAREQRLRVVETPVTIEYHEKPKRPVIAHGLLVLNGVLHFVGQYRPLLFFGLGGLLVTLASLALGGYVVLAYQRTHTLAVGYAMITVLLGVIGMLTFVTGVILHSVRGLLADLEVKLTRNEPRGNALGE